MGKAIERVKITNVFEPSKSIEIDALIDTGATMVVLPQDIVSELGLMKVYEATRVYPALAGAPFKPLQTSYVRKLSYEMAANKYGE